MSVSVGSGEPMTCSPVLLCAAGEPRGATVGQDVLYCCTVEVGKQVMRKLSVF